MNLNHKILIALSALTICSCDRGYHELDFGAFQVTVPPGWQKEEQQGIDSYVGIIKNDSDKLYFDYGWYSYALDNEDPASHYFSIDTINGKKAFVVTPKETGKGILGVYIDSAYNDNHFNLIGRNIKREREALEIFASICFKDSDTSLNSVNFGKNYLAWSLSQERINTFKRNCASCHKLYGQQMIGSPFDQIPQSRFDLWFSDSAFTYVPQNENLSDMGPDYHREMMKSLSTDDLKTLRTFFKQD